MERHIVSVVTDNEFGILARIVGLFSARGYNIESLAVDVVDSVKNLSRVNIVTFGDQGTIDLIVKLLEKMVPVRGALDLTSEGEIVERMLCLCRVGFDTREDRLDAIEISKFFRAKVVDSAVDYFTFEVSGSKGKIDAFITRMQEFSLLEVSKTGFAALNRDGSLGEGSKG